MRKQRGVGNFITMMISVVALIGLLVYGIHVQGDMEKGRKITETMRKYVLIMEGNGCLKDAEKQALVQELESLGVTGITFHGEPLRQVPYGGEVELSISGTLDGLKITGWKDFVLVREGNGVRFTKTMKSTSQY